MLKVDRLFFLSTTVSFFEVFVLGLKISSKDRIKTFVQPGDINLGALVNIGTTDSSCHAAVHSFTDWFTAEAVVYAVKKVNEDQKVLPGLKLGFAIANGCADKNINLEQARRFHPAEGPDHGIGSDGFDVVGLIVSGTTTDTIYALNKTWSKQHMPYMSVWVTDDPPCDLTADSLYFLRIIPDINAKIRAIVQFLSKEGLTYISIVYSEKTLWESCLRSVRKLVNQFSMCLDSEHEIKNDSSYLPIATKLKSEDSLTEVIILVGSKQVMAKMFDTVGQMMGREQFIWICTNGMASGSNVSQPSHGQGVLGSFTTSFYAPPMNDFDQYITSLEQSTSKDPWLKDVWPFLFNSSLDKDTSMKIIHQNASVDYLMSYAIDAVFTFARALDSLMAKRCRGKAGSAAAACVMKHAQGVRKYCHKTFKGKDECDKNDLMIGRILAASFNGKTGIVEFSRVGNRQGTFVISQIVEETGEYFEKPIGVVSPHNVEKLNDISWKDVWRQQSFSEIQRRKISYIGYTNHLAHYSACGKSCGRRGRKTHSRYPCCWKCILCDSNEILDSETPICYSCPQFHWPDRTTNYTSCSPIKPILHRHDDPTVGTVLVLVGTGMTLTISSIFIFIFKRNHRLIKASGRELSFIQLGALLIGFLSMGLYTMQSNKPGCIASYFFVSLSYNTIFSTMLIKNVRVYRVFRAASEGRRNLKGVKPISQLCLAGALMLGQCVVCTVMVALGKIDMRLYQPNPQREYVEFYCSFGLPGFAVFIASHLVLAVPCAIIAYKMRAFPSVFNESRHIIVCVAATSVFWLGIVIASVAFREAYSRIDFVASISMFNLLVVVLCLYISRVFDVMTSRARSPSMCNRRTLLKMKRLTVYHCTQTADQSEILRQLAGSVRWSKESRGMSLESKRPPRESINRSKALSCESKLPVRTSHTPPGRPSKEGHVRQSRYVVRQTILGARLTDSTDTRQSKLPVRKSKIPVRQSKYYHPTN